MVSRHAEPPGRPTNAAVHSAPFQTGPCASNVPHPRHHPHRLSRLRQNHAAAARADRGARAEDCRHRKRVWRGEHRQRHSGERRQRADRANEQRLRVLHHPRRLARHPGRSGRPKAQRRARLRTRDHRNHRPGRPWPRGADFFHGRRSGRAISAGRHRDLGRCQARHAAAR